MSLLPAIAGGAAMLALFRVGASAPVPLLGGLAAAVATSLLCAIVTGEDWP